MKWQYIVAIACLVIGITILASNDDAFGYEPPNCPQMIKDSQQRCKVPDNIKPPKAPLCFGAGCPNAPKSTPPKKHQQAPAVPNTGV